MDDELFAEAPSDGSDAASALLAARQRTDQEYYAEAERATRAALESGCAAPAAAEPGGGSLRALAGNLPELTGHVAWLGGDAYWPVRGEVRSCSIATMERLRLAAGIGQFSNLAVDQGALYWDVCPAEGCNKHIGGRVLVRKDRESGELETLAEGLEYVTVLRTGSGFVYWAEWLDRRSRRRLAEVGPCVRRWQLALLHDEAGELHRIPISGGTPEPLAAMPTDNTGRTCLRTVSVTADDAGVSWIWAFRPASMVGGIGHIFRLEHQPG